MTIRRQPEDFVVGERLLPACRSGFTASWSRGTPHAVFELTKTSLTTPEAIQRLARELSVRHADVSYAGLKDRHARTTQHVSIEVPRAERAAVMPRAVEGRGWSGRLLGWSPAAISAECIEGNFFAIVVRGLSREACDEMDRRARLLTLVVPRTPGTSESSSESRDRKPASLLILNYFGDQRFGSARHGEGWVARALIKGDFDQALRLAIGTPARKDSGHTRPFTRLCAEKWGRWKELARELPPCPERAAIEALAAGKDARDAFASLPYFLQSMCVEAYQSHLWNEAARRIARSLGGAAVLRSSDPFGEMLFPTASAVNESWRGQDMPLLGPRTTFDGPWADAAKAALAEEGIARGDLTIPGLRRPFFGEARRPLFFEASRFDAPPPEPDELDKRPGRLKRTVSFQLPRGAYATVVLRALGQ